MGLLRLSCVAFGCSISVVKVTEIAEREAVVDMFNAHGLAAGMEIESLADFS